MSCTFCVRQINQQLKNPTITELWNQVNNLPNGFTKKIVFFVTKSAWKQTKWFHFCSNKIFDQHFAGHCLKIVKKKMNGVFSKKTAALFLKTTNLWLDFFKIMHSLLYLSNNPTMCKICFLFQENKTKHENMPFFSSFHYYFLIWHSHAARACVSFLARQKQGKQDLKVQSSLREAITMHYFFLAKKQHWMALAQYNTHRIWTIFLQKLQRKIKYFERSISFLEVKALKTFKKHYPSLFCESRELEILA